MKTRFKKLFDAGTLDFLYHSKNYLSASLFVNSLSIVSIPIMTRLLSTSEFGLLSVVISFAGMLSVIFGLGTQVENY